MHEFAGTARYRVQRRLGAGGFGAVFQVLDRDREQSVALKVLRRIDPESLIRFKREFRALSELSHDNLVQLHELDSDEALWFFTMELVRGGTDFARYVCGDGRAPPADTATAATLAGATRSAADAPVVTSLSVERLEDAFAQLVRAVSVLHQNGILHRDLKPSNVQVDEDGRVVVLDFGLVTSLDASGYAESVGKLGTPRYVAPEQASGERTGPASDWYSVGVMLYEVCTGVRPPSDGVPRVDRFLEEVPPHLRALALQLLSADPSARPTGAEIRARLGLTTPSAPSRRHFVGRRAELDVLRSEVQEAARAGPRAVFLHGPAGSGKTSLLEAFAADAEPGVTVLLGRSLHQERLPFKAVDALLDGLARRLAGRPLRQVPSQAGALVVAFPVFRQIPELRQTIPATGTRSAVRARAYDALAELVAQLSADRPVVLLLDDLQWGDEESAELIDVLFTAPSVGRLLLVLSYRSDDFERSPMLRRLRRVSSDAVTLELGPLDEDAVNDWLTAAGREGDSREVIEEAAGSPDLLRRFADAPALCTLAELVQWELRDLPEDARALLDVVALAGSTVPWTLARDAVGARIGRPALDRLLRARLLRVVGSNQDEDLALYHSATGAVLRGLLSPEAHRRVLEGLSAARMSSGRPDRSAERSAAERSAAERSASEGRELARRTPSSRPAPPSSSASDPSSARLPRLGLAAVGVTLLALTLGAVGLGFEALPIQVCAPVLALVGFLLAVLALRSAPRGPSTALALFGLAFSGVVFVLSLVPPMLQLPAAQPGAPAGIDPVALGAVPLGPEVPLEVGTLVYVRSRSTWYRGQVLLPFPDGRAEVRYEGYSDYWDEVVTRDRLMLRASP